MASEAQVAANRSNAQKSTGPRTPEGKATVAQNAVKHGLSGRVDVIKGEDQVQFDLLREQILAELVPAGTVESMLAERVVSLSWRLKRVERMQNEVFDALLADEATPLAKLARSLAGEGAEEDGDLALGRAVLKDFGSSRALDRLLMYERRMEHSLLKTLNELKRMRVMGYISRQMDEIGAEPAGMGPVRVSRSTGILPVVSNHGRDAHATEMPDGVTPNAPAEASHHSHIPSFQNSADGWARPMAQEQSCKTKPICPEAEEGQVLCGAGVREAVAEDGYEETKPIPAWQDAPAAERGVA